MEFQEKLLQVGKSLNKDKVQALAFLCSDLLHKDLSCVSADELFSLLRDYDLLTPEDPGLLHELLVLSKENSLLRRLDLQPPLKNMVSPYRKLLFHLSENITEEDLKSIKFLLQEQLPRRKLEDSVTMVKLLWEMEKEDYLSETNLDTLENIIGRVCPYLKKRISQYKRDNVSAGPATQETGTTAVRMRNMSAKDPSPCTGDQANFSHLNRPASMGSFPESGIYTQPDWYRSKSSEPLLPPSAFTALSSSPFKSPHTVNCDPSSAGLLESRDSRAGSLSVNLSQLNSGDISVSSEQSLHVLFSSCCEERNFTATQPPPEGKTITTTTEPPPKENLELEAYEMKGEKRGVCLIINNYDFSQTLNKQKLKNREGTQFDEERLREVFTWLGFETRTERDCDRQRMLSLLEELSKEDHAAMDCLVCCLLSHGLEGEVLGVDGEKLHLRDITEPFKGANCASLRGKPKMFFIQACQGKKEQRPVFTESDGDGDGDDGLDSDAFVPRDSIPEDADFLLGMATMPHFVSFRHLKQGTWYIQSLCQNLKLLVPSGFDLLSILTRVNHDVGGMSDRTGTRKQMPQPVYSLRKRVVFPIPRQPAPVPQAHSA